MAQPFPKHEHLMGGYEPLRTECDAPDLVIEGEVPAELRGVFMRNGPNPQYAPRGEYHLFAATACCTASTLPMARWLTRTAGCKPSSGARSVKQGARCSGA